uniref:MAPK regulated co-repressor interacting protein 2 n=1 Tax=Rattus norvegicus TaxID=10116 RepID=A0ABK0LI24_RAT
CPSHLRRNPERRGAPEPRKASRPAGTASAWRSGRCSPGLRLPPPTVGAAPFPPWLHPRLLVHRAWSSCRQSTGIAHSCPAPGLCLASPLDRDPGPRLVFNRVNGRRPLTTSPSLEGTQETYTVAHEENVRFVSEAWQQVERQLDGCPADDGGPRPVQYVESTPDPRLQNFVPIDLDEWWAQQFLAKITNCS